MSGPTLESHQAHVMVQDGGRVAGNCPTEKDLGETSSLPTKGGCGEGASASAPG